MSRISLKLKTIRVVEKQSGDGAQLELRIQATDGVHSGVWPALDQLAKVDNGGSIQPVDVTLGTYSVNAGSLSKRVDITLVEKDGGFGGKDDHGSGSTTFELTPNMSVVSRKVLISLKRPDIKKTLGKVEIEVCAQPER